MSSFPKALAAAGVPLVLSAGLLRCGGSLATSPPPDGGHDSLPPIDASDARPGSDVGPDTRLPGDSGATEGRAPLGLGTVTNVTYTDTCPSSFGPAVGVTIGAETVNPNFRCVTMTVSCPGIVDLDATVALSPQPSSVTAKGVIVAHDGGDGTTFYTAGLGQAWFADGFDVAEVAWATPWECPEGSSTGSPTTCNPDSAPLASRPGLLDVACRPATVFAWVHDSAELPGGAPFRPSGAAFCGFGYSAGSGALWYSLLHYGLSTDFDFVGVTASTPYARIDIGCNPANASATVATPCSNLPENPEVPEQYDSNRSTQASLIDDWSGTTSCDVSPSAEELAYWKRTSIVSPGATYDIPTPVTSYDCINPANVDVVPGMNAYLYAELRTVDPTGARFQASCTLDGTNGSCMGEMAWVDGGALLGAAISDMEEKCVPIAH
jgi:hypothetical protein